MNGNFQVDKSIYPYGVITKGDGSHVQYTPGLLVLTTSGLPSHVAHAVALQLNTMHYNGPTGPETARTERFHINKLITLAAANSYESKAIDGPAYQHILDRFSKVV